MKKAYAYLIAEQFYFNSTNSTLCNRNWLFAIYKSLLISNSNDSGQIEWTKYNQWKIDHNCRAAKANALKNKILINSFSLNLINDSRAELIVNFSINNLKTESINCVYERDSFINSLWEYKNPKGETILVSRYERDQLFETSIHSFNELEESEIKSLSNKTHKTKKVTKKAGPEHVRNMKFMALNALLDQIREAYQQTEEPNQRSYFEIVVGAAIFYLPSLNSHFNGFISLNALKGYLKGDRRVKDHIYPRKLAARELLSRKMTLEELFEKYHNHLATYMYVTSSENSDLVNFYESYDNHDEAMMALGIEKFPTNEKEKFKTHTELNQFIETIDRKAAQQMNSEDLMELLRVFRTY